MLHDSGRADYTSATDTEALEATKLLSRTEGIIPALESAHAIAEAIKLAPKMGRDKILMVNVSGRGDKDMGILTRETEPRRIGRSRLMNSEHNESRRLRNDDVQTISMSVELISPGWH